MKIAVLSGKGGTGKTFVSVNLAAVTPNSQYMDCDVEEPNGHLFFQPADVKIKDVSVKIPKIDEERCNGCRICVDFCKFNALASIKNKAVLFDDICHSCGGCALLCPEKAIQETEKVIGKIENGVSEDVRVSTGILNIGEASGVPIIRGLLLQISENEQKDTFIDCPPGSACVVMESIRDVDYCVLVAEPTLFGVHNLQMVYELVKLFQIPHGVVLNKCMAGSNPAYEFCVQNGIHILGQIPFDKELGHLNADAKIAVREHSEYQKMFSNILGKIRKEVRCEAASDSKW